MPSKTRLLTSLSLLFLTGSFLGLTATAGFARSVSFSAATIIPGPVETGPLSNAGDFNGDGNLDLAVADEDSGTVSILLGTGTGAFAQATAFYAFFCPKSVAVGDFNTDGKLDLAVAHCMILSLQLWQANVSILLGNGDGTFRPAATLAVGLTPLSVAVGDFNGDKKLDLAVANGLSEDISILLGNGDATFQRANNFVVGRNPYSVAAGDLNGDGNLDLAVANRLSNDVSVLLGTGAGYSRRWVVGDRALHTIPIACSLFTTGLRCWVETSPERLTAAAGSRSRDELAHGFSGKNVK